MKSRSNEEEEEEGEGLNRVMLRSRWRYICKKSKREVKSQVVNNSTPPPLSHTQSGAHTHPPLSGGGLIEFQDELIIYSST